MVTNKHINPASNENSSRGDWADFIRTNDRLRIFRPTETHTKGVPADPFQILNQKHPFQFDANREYYLFNQMGQYGESRWLLGSFPIEHPDFPGTQLYWNKSK